mgnify:CR=1 FL=1
MSTTQHPAGRPISPEATQADSTRGTAPTVDADAVLELLGDEYARAVVAALADRPAAAPALAESMTASRATTYRRLNELADAGLVASTVAVDPDGHHRKRYHLVVDDLRLRFGADGIELSLAE